MAQDEAAIDASYKIFIEKVAASKLVWALKDKKGWANSTSVHDEEISVIPFWSERALAKSSAKGEWRDYTATEIPLPDFLENWCLEMADENILAGINWDISMFGKEVDALRLALDILTQLKAIQSAIKFSQYGSIDEFIAEINEFIS